MEKEMKSIISTDAVICKEVIITTITRRGKGEKHSPIRIITQVFEKDGTLIAEHDPAPETFTAMNLIHFARWAEEKKLKPALMNIEHVNAWLNSIEAGE